jgi:oxygen-independent coproporphyrinogen-3 oxidase
VTVSAKDGQDSIRAASKFGGLYVHVPFCGRRCTYCDFAIAVRTDVPVAEYIDAVLAELDLRLRAATQFDLKTVYLGGGTPSKLGGAGISRLLSEIAQRLGVEKLSTLGPALEVTIEVNPEDVSPEAAESWARSGVNRASVGLQSFDPGVLKWMHRQHSPEQAEAAVGTMQAAGISDLSVDLIFAVPETLGRDWGSDLDRALALEVDHLSIYGLTVEPHTPLGKWTARGEVTEAPEERYEAEFVLADTRLAAAGYEHYEVSNYARAGKRARHNSSYWSGVPYLGIGPSAHSYDGVERRWNIPAYAGWLAAMGSGRDPEEGRETIGPRERVAEEVYLGLRTSGGLEIRQGELKTVTRWISAGWGELTAAGLGAAGGTGEAEAGRLVLNPTGWLRLDAIAAALTSLRSPS